MIGSSAAKRGKAAEHIFIAKCLLHGYECYIPSCDDGRVDVLVGPQRVRVQVKVLDSKKRRLMVMNPGRGTEGHAKQYRYTKDDVDFMVGVDADTMDVYVAPISITERFKDSVGASTLEKIGLKNNLDALGVTSNT